MSVKTKEGHIVQHLAVLREGDNGWRQELNLVSWYGKEPKYDIRWWSRELGKYGKGITLRDDELIVLYETLSKIEGIGKV